MAAVILTWNNEEDIRIIEDEGGSPWVFYSAMNAAGWIEENDSKVDTMVKVVDLAD